jgi:hypothetical protein
MKSRLVKPAILALLVLLLVAGSAPILAGADAPQGRTATGRIDTVTYGTAWLPELKGAFGNRWKTYGWGVVARVRAARAPTDQWVHIPITLLSYAEGTGMKVDLVQFCMKSSNWAQVYPITVDLWEPTSSGTGATRFYTGTPAWANNNNMQCMTVDIANDWKEGLGLSVKIHFGNASDTMTLGKAWARLVP